MLISPITTLALPSLTLAMSINTFPVPKNLSVMTAGKIRKWSNKSMILFLVMSAPTTVIKNQATARMIGPAAYTAPRWTK